MTTTTPANTPTTALALLAEAPGLTPAVVLSADLVNAIEGLVATYRALPPCTPDTLAEHDVIVRSAASWLRRLESERVNAKAPFLNMGRAIDAAIESVRPKLERVKAAGQAETMRVRDEVERQRVAAEQERLRAEREAAAAQEAARVAAEEAARLELEAQLEDERLKREAADLLEEAASTTVTPEDAAAATELAAEVQQEAEDLRHRSAKEAEDLRHRSAQETERQAEAAGQAYVASLDAAPAPLPKTGTYRTMVDKLQIDDETLIPDQVNGVRLKNLIEPAITRLLKAGVPVPGARLVKVEKLGTRG